MEKSIFEQIVELNTEIERLQGKIKVLQHRCPHDKGTRYYCENEFDYGYICKECGKEI